MRLLTLVRHAKSSWRFSALDDFHRPLNKRGLRDCQKVPRYVHDRLPRPDRMLSSDSVRTVQTCQALADAYDIDGAEIHLDHDLYLADRDGILGMIRRIDPSVQHAMMVGHNPGMTEVYNYLCGESLENIPTFGVAHLVLEVDDWARVDKRTARPAHYFEPKQI